MTERKASSRVFLAALSLVTCAAIGAYLAFTGFNGHPEEVSARDAAAGAADAAPQASAAPNDATGIAANRNRANNEPTRSATPVGVQTAQTNEDAADKSGQTFNDWTIRCQKNDAGEILNCEAFQRLSVRDTGQRFLELAVGFPAGAETPLAIFVLPLGLWLPPGMDLQIDDGEPKKAPIQRCIQGGCLVQLPLSGDLLAELKRGKQMAVQVYRQQDDPMAVPISLIGFTAALEEIRPE